MCVHIRDFKIAILDLGLSVAEICAVSKISKKDIGRVFKMILKTLETNVELITTGDFMVRKIV